MLIGLTAPSTKILLGGQRPSQFDPTLYDGRLKRNMIQTIKGKVYPVGLRHTGKSAQFCAYF